MTKPTFPDLIRSAIAKAITELHTAIPAIVDTFDSATQTAKVLPSIRRIRVADGETFDIAPIINVPVMFPSAGGFSVTFPVTKGDEVLLVFSERAIDNWQQLGGVRDPADRRKHDYTDAVAIIGLHSNAGAISGYSTDSLEIRSDDGETSVSISSTDIIVKVGDDGGATFNSDGSVDFANGASLNNLGVLIDGLGRSSSAHTHTGVTTGGGVSGPPV